MGSDLTNANDANTLGASTRCYASKVNYIENYDIINSALSCYRNSDLSYAAKAADFSLNLNESSIKATKKYAKAINIDSDVLLKTD